CQRQIFELQKWNATNRPFASERTVVELFEDRVRERPDAIAVVFENQELTYREVNRRANRLAHLLIEQGIKPDTLVATCLERTADRNPKKLNQPSDLAYCIYTSGSTGQPKGVLISHRSLSDHIQGCIQRYELQPKDRTLAFASTNFDASIEQIFTPLCSGGCLV